MMHERIYLPVRCSECGKMSIVSLTSRDATHAIQTGDSLFFTCAFDGTTWQATSSQRTTVQRLLSEATHVGNRPYLRLTPPHPHRFDQLRSR